MFQVDAGVTASLSGLTITGGNAGSGGGLFNDGTVTLTDATVSGNSAANSGGGLTNLGGLPHCPSVQLTRATRSARLYAPAAASTTKAARPR